MATAMERAKAKLATNSASATVRCSLPRVRLAGGIKPADLMGLRITNLDNGRFGNSSLITQEPGNGSTRLGQSD